VVVADSYQPVELEDGSTAYIALSGSVLNALSLEGFATLGGESHVSGAVEDEEGELFVRDRAKSFMCPHEGCGKLYTTLHHLKVKLCSQVMAEVNDMVTIHLEC
jgi:hypothetical protein